MIITRKRGILALIVVGWGNSATKTIPFASSDENYYFKSIMSQYFYLCHKWASLLILSCEDQLNTNLWCNGNAFCYYRYFTVCIILRNESAVTIVDLQKYFCIKSAKLVISALERRVAVRSITSQARKWSFVIVIHKWLFLPPPF